MGTNRTFKNISVMTDSPRKNSKSSGVSRGINSYRSTSQTLNIFKDYGGLGHLYYETLASDLDKILQVDIIMSIAETKGSVRSRSIRLASEMRACGIVEKDIVVVCSGKNADQTIASLFLGAIVAPLDPESSNKEKDRLIRKLKPKICFADSRTETHIKRILHEMHLQTKVVSFSQEDGGISEFSKWIQHKEDEEFRPIYIEDPRRTVALILPTQGTTDFPKLVCVSHNNICLQCMNFADIFYHPVNILSFFSFSWFLHIIMVCLCLETSVTLIIPGLFFERSACKVIQDFNVECLLLGTDFAMRLFHSSAAKDYNLSCLKTVMIGVNNTTPHDIYTLKKAMPKVQFLSNYSMVETGCIAATRSKDYPSIFCDKPTTVGSLTLNCKVKIINIHTKEVCPPKKVGEIYYSGDGLMLGYFKDPERTMASREKGYFRTGDVGMFDEAGWLFVRGRLEDMIDIDNWSLFPLDIEDIVLRHPYVKDAVVIGNQKTHVILIKKNLDVEFNEPDLKRYICESLSPKYWPSRIILQEHFPRTNVGSVKRRTIREDLLQVSIRYSSSLSLLQREESLSN
ncbi:luciferin 4-monooxygenase-like isoform X2 [Diorhabda carinulata]|uniref:luciferin 4-monooxygenase-like isoform X2 n=1 Tax=Diorhabda carinulata TaxID=1163345 RepID=UPI0025A1B628|nr:luciferin 4-monooxygenase-like isoform X2 [Diorhabda carinulata]